MIIPVISEDEWADEPKTDIIKALLDSDAPGSNEEAERLMRKKLYHQARRLTPQPQALSDPFPPSEAPTNPARKPRD